MQRLRFAVAVVLAGSATLGLASTNGLRNVFLNGIDISSAKSQDLKHVDVRISDTGDIFLVAPHYQVNEEDSFVPLSRYVQGLNQPVHQPAQKISGAMPAKPGPAMATPVPIGEAVPSGEVPAGLPTAADAAQPAADGLEPKAGEPAPKAAGEGAVPPLPATPDTAAAAADKGANGQTAPTAK